jgi:fatty acid desaturase
MKIKMNMSKKDKLIRVVIAFLIAMLFYFQIIRGLFGVILMLIAIAMLLTCFFRVCPLYKIMGYSTNKEERD